MKLQILTLAYAGLALAGSLIPVPDTRYKGHDELVEYGVNAIAELYNSTHLDKCGKCLSALQLGKTIALQNDKVIPEILIKLCEKYHWEEFCTVEYQGFNFGVASKGAHIANVLTLIDPTGIDGEYLCYYQVRKSCPLPPTPKYNLTGWWPEKPKNLSLPKSEGETFNVVHLSDFHVDLRYQVGGEANCTGGYHMCCVDALHNGPAYKANYTDIVLPAQKFGSYDCDIPQILLEDSLANVAKIGANKSFEFGIFTGDMVSHDIDSWFSLAKIIESEEDVYYNMKKYLGDIPIYSTFGNHDSFPYAQQAQNKSGFLGEFIWNAQLSADLWKDYGWIDEETQAEAIHTYGSFAVNTKRGLRVISLDSNLWYQANYYNYWNMTDPDTSGLMKWLVDELVDAEKKGIRVWIMAHVPTGGGTGNAMPHQTEVIRQIIDRFAPETIVALFFGHTHEDQFNVYYAGNGTDNSLENALTVGWISQSVTPLHNYNPSWRYYEVDTKTFEIVNSINYYAQLNKTFEYDMDKPELSNSTTFPHITYPPRKPDEKLDWIFEYSARDVYDPDHKWPKTAPLNATFWHNAIQYIVTNDTGREDYLKYEYRESPFVPDGSSPEYIKNMYCYFSSGTVPAVYECHKRQNITKEIWI
ncbi:Sphingomyelin phosphodiesterase 2 [Yarrowia sp. C11]|nr:Sphingomyelin phosphodiesterase 2 [Yarrowia sp. C11]KAG5370889.1 Sphingomyelin phosphodiesterase 2 [Yarrowia sp. E02]